MQRFLLILSIAFVLFYSCQKPEGKIPVSTHYFDSIIVVSETLIDSGYKDMAVAYIRKQYNDGRGLNIEDKMNYYSYLCNIYASRYSDYDKSIEIADSMLMILGKANKHDYRPRRWVQAYNSKADALAGKGLYNDAFNAYFKAKLLASANQDACSTSMFSYHMGMVLFKQQKYHQATEYFKQAYNEMYTCPDNFSIFYRKQELLDNIGLSYSREKLYDSAITYYNKCLDFIQENYKKYPYKSMGLYETAKAVVYGNLADVYLGMGNADTAISLLRKSVKVNLQKGYANVDAEQNQLKLGSIFLSKGKVAELKSLLDDIKAELDTVPNKQVELQWNNLMYQYYTTISDSIASYRYAVTYIKMNDSLQASKKGMIGSDIEEAMKSMEHDHRLAMLEKDKEKRDFYLMIIILITIMAISVVVIILRNSARADTDLKMLKDLNNEIVCQKQKLENLLKELEEREKDKSRILRSVAHDVMSPISAISALTDILVMEGSNLNEEQKEMLNLIYEACGNSLNLSNEILEAADTIDPRKMTLEKTDINKLLISSIELLNIKAAVKKQKIAIELPPFTVEANVNKDKIRRVIENLIGNAIKFSFELTTITVSLGLDGSNVLIKVKDSGVGIPEKNRANVFDMFTESKTYGTSGEKPHGIGLSIALQVAKAHGGDIRFESEEGKGTTFYLTFPFNA